MTEFLDRARSWMDSDAGWRDRDVFQHVFEFIADLQPFQPNASARLRDIEEMLALFELGALFWRIGPRDGDAARQAVPDMRRLIVRTIEASMLFPVVDKHV